MARYHCRKCDVRFVKEELNMNQRHGCGEFAYVEWETEHEGGFEREVAKEE